MKNEPVAIADDNRSEGRIPRLLWNTKETCEALGGIHPRTLLRWEKEGKLRSIKLLRHKMFPPEEVKQMVQNYASWTA